VKVIENEGVRSVATPDCPGCRRRGRVLYAAVRDRIFDAPGTWDLLRCPACELVWLDPQPLPEELGKLYEREYVTQVPASLDADLSVQDKVRQAIVARTHGYPDIGADHRWRRAGRVLSRIGPLREAGAASVRWLPASQRGRLLDVGCGNGAFLARMRDLGWRVAGVEPDPVAGSLARDHSGLAVVVGTLDEANFEAASFDVITLSHVIEHVPDPGETIRECRRLLAPGGRLLMVTPNTRCLARRCFGPSWMGWSTPQHLMLFTPALLRGLTEEAGLRVVHVRTSANAALVSWQAGRAVRRDGALASDRMREMHWHFTVGGVLFWVVEHALATVLPWGEEIVLVATTEPAHGAA